MRLLDWLSLRDCPYNCRLLYILHEPEEDEKKPHYHVMVRFDNQKTVGAVRKMFGLQADVWRLYTMIESDIVDDLKMKHGSPERVRNLVYKKFPVLSDSENPDSYIQFPYDKSNLYNAKQVTDMYNESYCPIDDDQAFIRTKVYTVQHIEVVSDCNAYALYMLHANYDCIIQGKKPYRKEQLKGNMDFMFSCFPEMKNISDLDSISRVFELTKKVVNNSMSRRDLIAELIQTGDEESFKYIRENSSFIRDWLLDTWKKDDYF